MMQRQIMSLVISDEILNSAGLSDQEFLVEIAVMLFQKARVSLGKASKKAGKNINDTIKNAT